MAGYARSSGALFGILMQLQWFDSNSIGNLLRSRRN